MALSVKVLNLPWSSCVQHMQSCSSYARPQQPSKPNIDEYINLYVYIDISIQTKFICICMHIHVYTPVYSGSSAGMDLSPILKLPNGGIDAKASPALQFLQALTFRTTKWRESPVAIRHCGEILAGTLGTP